MTHYFHFSAGSESSPLRLLLEAELNRRLKTSAGNWVLPPDAPFDSALPDDVLWRRYEHFDVTHITESGDLVLDIHDLFAPYGFWSSTLVQSWAKAQSLSIDDLDHFDVLQALLEGTLLLAMDRLLPNGNELARLVPLVMEGQSAVPDLPDFRIVVNGRLAVKLIIDHFDGPFASESDALAALQRRITPATT
jgi:hypothetical protein